MTVHPLSQGAVAIPDQGEDLTAGRFEHVGLASVIALEANPNGARNGVDAKGVDRIAANGQDGESDHGSFRLVCFSLQGQAAGSGGSVCHPLNCPSYH